MQFHLACLGEESIAQAWCCLECEATLRGRLDASEEAAQAKAAVGTTGTPKRSSRAPRLRAKKPNRGSVYGRDIGSGSHDGGTVVGHANAHIPSAPPTPLPPPPSSQPRAFPSALPNHDAVRAGLTRSSSPADIVMASHELTKNAVEDDLSSLARVFAPDLPSLMSPYPGSIGMGWPPQYHLPTFSELSSRLTEADQATPFRTPLTSSGADSSTDHMRMRWATDRIKMAAGVTLFGRPPRNWRDLIK